MKRSKVLQITGLMAGAGFSLTACGQNPSTGARVYEYVEDCTRDHGAAECKAAIDEAALVRRQTGPRFDTKEDCEREWGFGRCDTLLYGSRGMMYGPYMSGFVYPQTVGGVRNAAAPIYKDEEGQGSNGYGGGYVSRGFFSGYSTTDASQHTPQARSEYARTLAASGIDSRGGFGASGRSYIGGHSGYHG